MAKQSYTEILSRVHALQEQAEIARKQEMGSVIEKIKEAVRVYKLTPEDIFGKEVAAQKPGRGAGTAKSKKATVPTAGKGYRLGDNHWGGRGPRPAWFKEALEAGKTAEEMRA